MSNTSNTVRVNLWQNSLDVDFSFTKHAFNIPETQTCVIQPVYMTLLKIWSPRGLSMEIWYFHWKCVNSYTDIKVDMSRAVQLQGTENAEWPERKGCMSKHSINRPSCRLTWENINFLLLNAVVEGEKKNNYFVLVERCVSACVGQNHEIERETERL